MDEYYANLNCGQKKLLSIEYVQFDKGNNWEQTLRQCEMCFVLSGSFIISYDRYLEKDIETDKAILLPPGCHFKASTDTGVELLVYKLYDLMLFCDRTTVRSLMKSNKRLNNEPYFLSVKQYLKDYLIFLRDNLVSGLNSNMFLELKGRELFILLKEYYTKDELASFLSPMLTRDISFSTFVLNNYTQVKTVNDFARLYACSLSSFEKRFKSVFGTSPYKWMKDRKVNLVFHELNTTNKPIKQIADEQGFPSLPQFNDYCKKHLGYPPGKLRKAGTNID